MKLGFEIGKSLLGRESKLIRGHAPEVLFPIDRQEQRSRYGIEPVSVPFVGLDRLNCYELNWLSQDGSPSVGGLQITIPVESPAMIESKSLRLYIGGLAHEVFKSKEILQRIIAADLSRCVGSEISAVIVELDDLIRTSIPSNWSRLDTAEGILGRIETTQPGQTDTCPVSLGTSARTVYTHAFRCLCPVTGQPDYATMVICYRGVEIPDQELLAYLMEFREWGCFHETLVERIFVVLHERYCPSRLSVTGHFLRRGGIDINPYRGTEIDHDAVALILSRQ